MIRVAIIDDEELARKRLERLLSAMPHVEIAGICEDGEALMELLRQDHDLDALLLDIHMPGLSGLELSSLLPPDGPQVILVSAHPEHALEAFEVGVLDYVIKPVAPGRLKQAIDRISPRQAAPPPLEKLPIKTHKGVLLVDLAQLQHASYDGVLVTLGLDDGGSMSTDLSLSELEARLPRPPFMRVHRRHILHLDKIDRLEPLDSGGYHAYMQGGDRVRVSRQAARELRRILGI